MILTNNINFNKMSIIDKFETSEHRKNVAHFAAIIKLAKVDGTINAEEEIRIKRFATKLNITEKEFEEIVEKPDLFPVNPLNTSAERLEVIYDLFKIIYADHFIDEAEEKLVHKYALSLGCGDDKANELIKKSIQIFGGGIDFEGYQLLIND